MEIKILSRFLRFVIFLTLLSMSTLKAQDISEYAQSSSLAGLNMIGVTIGGEFIITGSFPASSTERLDQFVTRIFNQGKANILATTRERIDQQYLAELETTYPLRDIKLVRANGEERIIDLLRFRLTGNFEHNPYLLNDDVIIFPAVDIERNFFTIAGAVNSPGTFQFVDGDKLSDALFFARGINKAFEKVEYAEISRLSFDGFSEQIIEVALEDDIELVRGDRINIHADETQRKEFSILIEGEVKNPGEIFIKKETTLREVLLKAGGFTENADLRRAELIRGKRNEIFANPNDPRRSVFSESFELLMMQRMAHIDRADSAQFLVDNRLKFSRANGVIKFEEALDEKSEASTFPVRDGDYIFVPQQIDLVYVFGHVGNPGYIDYKKEAGYNYYIEQAGGIGQFPLGDYYLIKAKSREWIALHEDENTEIDPGDYIWIPKEPYKSLDYYITRIANYTSILGSVATVILLITQVSK